jgi:NAD-dependent DNA ligase
MSHPEALISDLGLDKNAYSRLIAWLKLLENCSDCVEILNMSNIKLIKAKKHVDGSPIFRDKKIYITGVFSHGTTEDIISILEGYSATVFTKFDQSVDCVVVGDVPENVNGHAINEAKNLTIPVIDETTFFNMYRIDSDIVQ